MLKSWRGYLRLRAVASWRDSPTGFGHQIFMRALNIHARHEYFGESTARSCRTCQAVAKDP